MSQCISDQLRLFLCGLELVIAENILDGRPVRGVDYDLVANHASLTVVELHYGSAGIILRRLQQVLPLHGVVRLDPHDRQEGRRQVYLAGHFIVKTRLDIRPNN